MRVNSFVFLSRASRTTARRDASDDDATRARRRGWSDGPSGDGSGFGVVRRMYGYTVSRRSRWEEMLATRARNARREETDDWKTISSRRSNAQDRNR